MRKVALETVDAIRRRLAVEVPASEVTAEIEDAYAKLRRNARVKGFRPGKAPRSVLEQMFGEQVRLDVLTKLIQSSYREALDKESIEPVSQPEIVTEQAEPGGPLRYAATVEVKPELVLTDYFGLNVDRPMRAVEEADVDAFLERLRQSLAQLRPITDRSEAQVGDIATLDYEARVGQRLLGRAESRAVEVGAGEGPDAIGPRLVGITVGGLFDFEIDYPADHADAELAGQHVKFSGHLKGIAFKDVPVLDDDFAKDHGECATLVELRERVRQRLQSAAEHDADDAVRNALLKQLIERYAVEPPRAMVERRLDVLVDEFMDRFGPRAASGSRTSELQTRLRSELEPRARQQVQSGLILEGIARQEQVVVTDDEIDAQVERAVEQAGGAGERIRALYQDPAVRAGLRGQLAQDRALDQILARAQVHITVDKSSVDAGS